MDRSERSGWVVYTREDCPLCDEFSAALAGLWPAGREPFVLRDVDQDPVTRRRFGLKVPALVVDGSLVCHGRLDAAEVSRLLESRPSGPS